jgi:predicted transcriptional regulator
MTDSGAEDMLDLLEESNPTFHEVMTCVFGVQPHVTRTYLALAEQPASTVEELADELERDRSNVNRSLTSLLDHGLAERDRRLLDSGGYVYQYNPKPLPEAKEMLHTALDAWADQVHETIDGFGDGRP